jgi:hypothetical protein
MFYLKPYLNGLVFDFDGFSFTETIELNAVLQIIKGELDPVLN